MSKKLYPETDIQNIANAIRTLNGSSDTYTVSQMASAIALPENGYYLKESTEANPLSITDGEELNAQSCEVEFSPTQDLHGYDSPWIDSDVINKEPYLFRAVRGTATRIGNSLYDTLVGGTVAFNQLVKNGNFVDTSSWGTLNGTLTVSGNVGTFSSSSSSNKYLNSTSISFIANHICLLSFEYKSDNNFNFQKIDGNIAIPSSSAFKKISVLDKRTTNAQRSLMFYDYSGSESWELQLKNVMVIDLTAMFGSTIADYIYSLEQATAGSGVAYFRSLFPKDYYDYNAGQLMSVKALSHKMVGFNQFDKSKATDGKKRSAITGNIQSNVLWYMSDYIRVFPNTVYYTNADGTGNDYPITLYDSEKNYIGYITGNAGPRTFNTGNATYIVLSSMTAKTNVDDLVLNLHWDGERDGEYEAYEEHIYPLDSDLELRGIPKLDTNNKLYYDGDTYESDGTVTRNYGIVDLGSLNWSKEGTNKSFYISISDKPETIVNMICSKYICITASVSTTSIKLFPSTIGQNSGNNRIYFYNDETSEMTTQQFATYMNGVYLVYELATPTTETADTFENPQLVDNWGTEEYTDSRTIQIPVGHETYQANICEISGWSGLNLTQAGKNLLAKSFVYDNNINYNLNNYFFVKAGIYRFSFNMETTNWRTVLRMKDKDGNDLSSSEYQPSNMLSWSETRHGWMNGSNGTVDTYYLTIATDCYIRLLFASGSTSSSTVVSNAQLELGTSRTVYEAPVTPTTHTTTFPSTIYGGSHEFVSGKAESEWGYIASYNGETITEPWISDRDVYVAGTTPSTGAEVCYKLATPTEITLTPSQIALLENNNVLWSDSNGNVKLKYFSKSLS